MIKKQNVITVFLCLSLFLFTGIFLTSKPVYISAATTSVALNTSDSYLVKGETTNLKVTGTTIKVTWTSSNKKIATVSGSGNVKAVGYGTAYIKATINNKTYNCKITVINPAKISFQPSGKTIFANGAAVSLNPKSDIYSATVLKKVGLTYKVSGNKGVKVSSTGKVTATEAGAFQIDAYVHGKKIETISMEAVSFEGFSIPELSIFVGGEIFVSFAGDIKPAYDDVKVTISNRSFAKVERSLNAELHSDIDFCKGIYVEGIKEGTCTMTVTICGVSKDLKIIVGDGLEKLDPVDAIKNNDFTGYTGDPLTTLTAIRKFIDENNLMSSIMSDREKITIIQNYLNATYSGKVTDDTYTGFISQVFLKGAGVCESYTTFFCFICESIGIEVLYCEGTIDDGTYIDGHAWNRVKADGKWYYIDTTWNAGLNCFDYFLSETLWSSYYLQKEGYYAEMDNDGVHYANCLD